MASLNGPGRRRTWSRANEAAGSGTLDATLAARKRVSAGVGAERGAPDFVCGSSLSVLGRGQDPLTITAERRRSADKERSNDRNFMGGPPGIISGST